MLKNEVRLEIWKLLDSMSQAGFGRMENIGIKNGCPYYTPASRIVRSVLLDKKKFEHTPSRPDGNFLLTERQIAFVNTIEAVRNGNIVSLLFSDGLPGRMDIAERLPL